MSSKAEAVLVRDLPRLSPSEAGSAFNFVDAALQFLSRWCAAYTSPTKLGDESYCCFVGLERVSDGVASAASFSVCECFREDEFRINSFADCHRIIAELNVADRPVIMFNSADRKVLWRAHATGEMHEALFRTEISAAVTSADFERVLKDFHYEYTASPQGLTKPWYSAPKLLTRPDLEQEIRDDLFVYLRFLLQDPFAVFREVVGGAGRADLLVYFHAEKEVFFLELKVLRAFVRKGKSRAAVRAEKTLSWAKEGIAQAFNYKRSNRSVGTAYACCFDARLSDTEIQELVDFAAELSVEYRRFFMFNSAPALHAAVAAGGART